MSNRYRQYIYVSCFNFALSVYVHIFLKKRCFISKPFTVALSQTKHKDAQEWQEFIYFNTVPRHGNVCDSHDEESEDEYDDLNIEGKDNFPQFQ